MGNVRARASEAVRKYLFRLNYAATNPGEEELLYKMETDRFPYSSVTSRSQWKPRFCLPLESLLKANGRAFKDHLLEEISSRSPCVRLFVKIH